MGTGGSFLQRDEFDLSDEPGVIKRIPIEMKPRRTLGSTLRSVGSLGRHPLGVSLRSTFSVELDNTEVEKIRKEFEIYKISKKTEMGDSLKKVNKLENENRRLRAELQALQKTCGKLRTQRDLTLDAEYQALERASSFETERNKVQKQFKMFRECKEIEIQDLLKAKERTEKALHYLDPESLSEIKRKDTPEDVNRYKNMWPLHESEPSIGSSTQLRSLQQALDLIDNEGLQSTSTALNNVPVLNFAQPFISYPSSVIRVYVAVSPDMSCDVHTFLKSKEKTLRHLCEEDDKFLSVVTFSTPIEDEVVMNIHEARKQEIKDCNIFIGILSNEGDRFLEEDILQGYVNDLAERPAIFLFHDTVAAAVALVKQVKVNGHAIIIEGSESLTEKLNQLFIELEKLIKMELGCDLSSKEESNQNVDLISDPEVTALSDFYGENEQQHALMSALNCVCEIGMNKFYNRLNEHILSAGPLPPLVVLGGPGSGKSLLLSKWLSNHVKRNLPCLVLSHLVGARNSRSARVISMVQRFTSQIMQIIAPLYAMTSDPARLMEEFPHWLERVSTRIPEGVVLMIDSADKFQDCEDGLSWLLDPLPVESKVIISASVETCPKVWRSWPMVDIEPFSLDEVSEFIQMTCLQVDSYLPQELEHQVLSRCKTGHTNTPLYLTLLMSILYSNLRWNDDSISKCLQCSNSEHLYQFLIQDTLRRHEKFASLIKKVLAFILVSQNGLPESALFDLIPDLTWDVWAPVYREFQNHYFLSTRNGLLVYIHQQAETAVELLSSETELGNQRTALINYYVQLFRSNRITCYICDELLGLLPSTNNLPLMREFLSNIDVFKVLYNRGRYAELLNCWRAIGLDRLSVSKEYFEILMKMEQAVSVNDVPSPEVANLFEMVGKFSKDLGLLNQAVSAFQRSLEIRESIDPDHPAVGRCFYLLGSLHIQWGKLATAESYFKQALLISEMSENSCQQWMSKTLDLLIILYNRQGKFDVVESLKKKSATIKMRAIPQERHSRAKRIQSNVDLDPPLITAETL